MPRFRRLLRWALVAFIALSLLGAIGLGILYYVVSAKVPDIESLRNVELQEPLYVYASDGRLIGLFGETRRYPVEIEKVPVLPDRVHIHDRSSLVIFRLQDSEGHALKDYDLVLTGVQDSTVDCGRMICVVASDLGGQPITWVAGDVAPQA